MDNANPLGINNNRLKAFMDADLDENRVQRILALNDYLVSLHRYDPLYNRIQELKIPFSFASFEPIRPDPFHHLAIKEVDFHDEGKVEVFNGPDREYSLYVNYQRGSSLTNCEDDSLVCVYSHDEIDHFEPKGIKYSGPVAFAKLNFELVSVAEFMNRGHIISAEMVRNSLDDKISKIMGLVGRR